MSKSIRGWGARRNISTVSISMSMSIYRKKAYEKGEYACDFQSNSGVFSSRCLGYEAQTAAEKKPEPKLNDLPILRALSLSQQFRPCSNNIIAMESHASSLCSSGLIVDHDNLTSHKPPGCPLSPDERSSAFSCVCATCLCSAFPYCLSNCIPLSHIPEHSQHLLQ